MKTQWLSVLLLGVVVADPVPEMAEEGIDKVDVVDVAYEDDDVSEEVKEEEHHRPAIHIPSIPSFQIVPQINFPGVHFPPIPLPQLPEFHLPKLPELPFKKETVFKTKTVFVEQVHQVTHHPVCVTAYVPKPPCHHGYEVKDVPEERQAIVTTEVNTINPTSAVAVNDKVTNVVRATADFTNPKVRDSYDDTYDDVDESEEIEDQVATFRNGRYLVAHPQPSLSEPQKLSTQQATQPLESTDGHIKVKPIEQNVQISHHGPGYDGLHQGALGTHDGHEVVHGLLRDKVLVTKTVYITNVKKIDDHKVTATLIAKNCLPSEHIIPHCKSHHGLFKEGDLPIDERANLPEPRGDENEPTSEVGEQ